MKELHHVTFLQPRIPEGWTEEEHNYSFERGALRSGRVAKLLCYLPGKGWNKIRVETEVEPIGGAALTCGNRMVDLGVDLKRGTAAIDYFLKINLAGKRNEKAITGGRHRVVFEFDHGMLRVLVDGSEVVSAMHPRRLPLFGLLELGFWEDCLVHHIRILGDNEVAHAPFAYPRREGGDFELEVNVDFFDDLIHAPWTKEMFDQVFAEFKSWGVKRCHWIYMGNSTDDCLLDHTYSPVREHYLQTIKNVGEIFPAAVKAAHAHGVEIYGMVKPFDMGFCHSFGESTHNAKTRGRLPRIGGPVGWITNFAAHHREYLLSRKPAAWGPAKNEVFTRVDIVKNNAQPAAFTMEDVRIFVSDDNAEYVPYEGPLTREEIVEDYPVWEHTSSGGRPTGATRHSRVMRFRDLEIRSKYVVLAVNTRAGSFQGDIVNMLHVFGEKGEERCLTFGVAERHNKSIPATHLMATGIQDFRTTGVEFDMQPGTPTGLFPGFNAIESPRAFDSADGILAFARGKEQGPIAALSPSFPEVRQWWLSWLKACLDAGADGIELRERNHHSPLTWCEYGFEAPVRDEFLKRHGVDIWTTDDFDKSAWRRLRGEAYTQFYREARALAKSYGKHMGIHLSQTCMIEPEEGAAMEIHWDWKTWLKENLADSVTMKEIWPGGVFAEEILSYTRPRGIKAIFCPYANNLWGRLRGEEVCRDWINLARKHDYDGFQLYECGYVMKGTAGGELINEQPALRKVFQKDFLTAKDAFTEKKPLAVSDIEKI